jgi:hypothetical protein
LKKIIGLKVENNANSALVSNKVNTMLILLKEGNIINKIFDR